MFYRIHMLQAFTKQKSDEILNLNNRLAQLKKQLEDYEHQASLQVNAGLPWSTTTALVAACHLLMACGVTISGNISQISDAATICLMLTHLNWQASWFEQQK